MILGFIGLGNLGTPLAENIIANTKQLYVYNRTASKAQSLVEKGAVLCNSVKELAAACDIVFSVVADDAALKAITEGPEGIAANPKAGAVHVSVSTILPDTATALSAVHEKYGNYYLGSPVMGRPEAVRARKLQFMVSGNKEVIKIVTPFLIHAGGAGVWEFGEEAGAAHTAKLCSNFLIVSTIESIAEGIQLAKKSGLDADAWLNMLTQTLFSSPVYINYSKILLSEAFLPAGFSLKLGLKDVNLVLTQAAAVQAKMPFGQAVHAQLRASMDSGHEAHDLTAIALQLK